ncbi:MAG: peptide deformylase [Bacteroidales bacterium]|nr:peptide deformylase [Bacteroidales bacterium]
MKNKPQKLTAFAVIILCVVSLVNGPTSCSFHKKSLTFTANELLIINDTVTPLMKVYTIEEESDSTLLRQLCTPFSNDDITDPAYRILAERMVRTVTDSTVDGVGIAGPQVGILRQIIAVQRYDKEGFPFEVYPNITIVGRSQESETGREGCLSVPNKNGMVERSQWVIISYTCPQTLTQVQDTVKGFTARIFQHETDHLKGILYTDYLK